MFISNAFAQGATQGGSIWSTVTGILPLVLMFGVLYFIMIRPQMRRQKEHRAMVAALAKGDEVATAGGIIGRVSSLSEQWVFLELNSNTQIQVQRTSVTQVLPKGTLENFNI